MSKNISLSYFIEWTKIDECETKLGSSTAGILATNNFTEEVLVYVNSNDIENFAPYVTDIKDVISSIWVSTLFFTWCDKLIDLYIPDVLKVISHTEIVVVQLLKKPFKYWQ